MNARISFALAVLVLAVPGLTQAQSITGTFRDQTNGSPIASAQVFIEDQNIGGLTQADGRRLYWRCSSAWAGASLGSPPLKARSRCCWISVLARFG